MFILARAIVYATLFISFLLLFIPARILEWSHITRPDRIRITQILGVSTMVIGGALVLWCILTFVFVGKGTPAYFDPPRRLVIQGPYRFVRNPMYLGAGLAVVGAAWFFWSWPLLAYAALFGVATHLFVIAYEEPTLTRKFGQDYAEYRRSVRRWLPSSADRP
jgi:protein-S-isoprenylcysteine O-methyltransferase Ste14